MNTKPHTILWLNHFNTNARFSSIRFKVLNECNPRLNFDPDLIDNVEHDTFISIEKDRIPLFLGSQFGIQPRIDDISGFFNGEKLIAILGKSLLSGVVAGLFIYKIEKNDLSFSAAPSQKVIFFRNQ